MIIVCEDERGATERSAIDGNNKFYPKGLVPIQSGPAIVERLARWRLTLETGVAKIYEVSIPAVLLLPDECEALRLGEAQQCEALGQDDT